MSCISATDGSTGLSLWRFYGATDAIGLTLSLPDVDGDQVADVFFGGWDNEDRVFCVSGAVARPGAYEMELGATLGELIERAGGPTGALHAILLGGAAGSFVGTDMLDLALTFEDAGERGVSLGSGVVMLFDESADFADLLARVAAFFRDESCGQCVPCRVGTVRQEELLARHVKSGQPLDRALLGEIEEVMKDASICGLGHTAAIAIRSAIDIGLLETV